MKNLLTIIFFIAALVLFVQIIQAQTVEDIISKYNKTRGTADQFLNIVSIRMEGTREILGRSFPVVVTKVQNELSRIDFEIADNIGYTIITQSQGWSFIPMKSLHPEQMPEDKLNTLQDELDIAGPTIQNESKHIKLSLEGKEEVNGMTAFKIRVAYPSGKSIIYMIDKQTNLLIQTKQAPSANLLHENAVELVTNFSDYKMVNGILFPFRISNASSGPMGGVMSFSQIEINVAVDKAMYHP